MEEILSSSNAVRYIRVTQFKCIIVFIPGKILLMGLMDIWER